MKPTKSVVVVVGALGLFIAGIVVGMKMGLRESASGPVAAIEKKVLFYRNPMDPVITSPTPAKDEMGMAYIPVYEGDEASTDAEGGPIVTVSPEITNSLGVRTESVTRGELARHIDTVGFVGYDQNRLSHVHLRAEGWIKDLKVHAAGEQVRKGELMFRFYSPELVNAQEEYLQALKSADSRLSALSRQRLKALDVSDAAVAQLRKTGRALQQLPFYAPQDGVVAQMNIREGMYVERDVDVMTLADLASVWVVVDVFEQQATWVGKGDKAEVRVTSIADRVWEGWVEYIYPDIDPKTRTLRVRLRFANAGIELKPNMYAQATLFTQPREALSVPRDAIIRSEAGDRVIMSKGNGRFQPVTVRTGIESGERTEILEGLTDGDAVVVSAQFLIDSEASLKATLRRIVSPTLPVTSKPQMDLYEATGEVKSVDASAHKLTLTHEPIPALGWPAMTMDFIAAKEVVLAALKPGMRVKFTLRKQDPVTYEITSLQQAGGGDL